MSAVLSRSLGVKGTKGKGEMGLSGFVRQVDVTFTVLIKRFNVTDTE